MVVLVLPMLGVGFGLLALAAWLRRRKSHRTWDLARGDDPASTHFIAFVYPTVTAYLVRLGWQLHGPAYLSIPAIGIGLGPSAVTLWEAGMASPTLTLTASDVTSATITPVSDGYRNHPAIQLMLSTANRGNRLQLNLRDVRHHTVSPAAIKEARKSFPKADGPESSRGNG